MVPLRSPELTGFLRAWSAGDEGALAKVFELVYPELRCQRAGRVERLQKSVAAAALRVAPLRCSPSVSDCVVLLGILWRVDQQPQHLVDPHQGVIHHDFTGAGLDPSGRTGSAVAALRGRLDGGQITEIPICVTRQEAVLHGATRTPVRLEVDEGLPRHA